MSENTAIATQAQRPGAVAAASAFTLEQIQAASFEAGGAIPSLKAADAIPLPISTEYWSPENPGEFKRVYIAGVQDSDIVDPQSGEVKTLPTLFMLEVTDEGKINKLSTASRVLVGNISDAIRRGQIIPGTRLTPVQITYLGQTKNRSNSKMSKRWEILPLVVAVQG